MLDNVMHYCFLSSSLVARLTRLKCGEVGGSQIRTQTPAYVLTAIN
jgi:hypothetical protein